MCIITFYANFYQYDDYTDSNDNIFYLYTSNLSYQPDTTQRWYSGDGHIQGFKIDSRDDQFPDSYFTNWILDTVNNKIYPRVLNRVEDLTTSIRTVSHNGAYMFAYNNNCYISGSIIYKIIE